MTIHNDHDEMLEEARTKIRHDRHALSHLPIDEYEVHEIAESSIGKIFKQRFETGL